jgi:hypothetical protein
VVNSHNRGEHLIYDAPAGKIKSSSDLRRQNFSAATFQNSKLQAATASNKATQQQQQQQHNNDKTTNDDNANAESLLA